VNLGNGFSTVVAYVGNGYAIVIKLFGPTLWQCFWSSRL